MTTTSGAGGYAILRTQKLKARAEITRSLKHSFREQSTPNANSVLTTSNTHIGGTNTAEVMKKLEARLPEKIRKNAVLAIEYLITASPDAMNNKNKKEQDKYFADAIEWLEAKHGSENVIYSGIHRDEKTPHLYAYVVPIDPKGNLNCRYYLGGKKEVLAELQTDFHDAVGKVNGLNRGLEGSKAKHQRVSEFYRQINQEPSREIPIPEVRQIKGELKTWLTTTTIYETDSEFAKRVGAVAVEHLRPDLERANKVRTAEKERKEARRAAVAAQRRVKELEKEREGLTPEEARYALAAARISKENPIITLDRPMPRRERDGFSR